MITPPTPRWAQPATASRMPARGMASATQSTPAGKAEVDFTHGRPLISSRLALTRWISPRKAKRCRLASKPAPRDPGDGEAPTMATERGRSIRSIADRTGVGAVSAIALVTAEPGPEAFLVQELLEALLAPLLRIEQASLIILGHQIVVGVVVRHVTYATIGGLGCAEHCRILSHQRHGEQLRACTQVLERHRLVDEIHGRSLTTVKGLAGHDVVERVALAHHLRHRLGHNAGRNDTPIDLGQSKYRFLGRYREVAGDKRCK